MDKWFTDPYARLLQGDFEMLGRGLNITATFITPEGWRTVDPPQDESWIAGASFARGKRRSWDLYLRILGVEVTVLRKSDE